VRTVPTSSPIPALQIFDDIVLKNKEYVDIVVGDAYQIETYYMGLVDEENKVNFYNGDRELVKQLKK